MPLEEFFKRKTRMAEMILASSTIDDLYSELLLAKEEIESYFPNAVERVKNMKEKSLWTISPFETIILCLVAVIFFGCMLIMLGIVK